jgi:hypothetical protein
MGAPAPSASAARGLLAKVVATAALIASGCGESSGAAGLERVDAFDGVIEAVRGHSLVALGEYHQMQEWHDFMHQLLEREAFVAAVDDLVVEFGNALYQPVADRYLLELQFVEDDELSLA